MSQGQLYRSRSCYKLFIDIWAETLEFHYTYLGAV